ncbi:MAG: 50S ribosomal protein L3 [Bacilli bacterium]|nr:50S ribosomal protein L3 [Bacilli bacterium]
MKQIIGRKIGLIKVFDEDGFEHPATVVEVLPNIVMQIKTKEKDGYSAYVIGYGQNKKPNKCETGIANKVNFSIENKTYVPEFYREISGNELDGMNLSVKSVINASIFKAGDIVDVISISKGKGFTGAVKRHHYKLGRKTHGSGYHRGLGSFANNGRCNNRVIPGKKMAGRSGSHQVTLLNELILESNSNDNFILIRGSLPGNMFTILKIRSAIKKSDINGHKNVKKLVNFSHSVEKRN